MKVLVAVPCGEMIHTDFVNCLLRLALPEGSVFHFMKGALVYDARNSIVETAIKNEMDQVLWLDSDMFFERDLYYNLNEILTDEIQMATAVYFTKHLDPYPVIYQELPLPNTEGVGKIPPYFSYPRNSVFAVEGCGFGACLTSVKLLEEMSEKYPSPFLPLVWGGEDFAFCSRLKELGKTIFADSKIKVGHIGNHVYTESTYLSRQGWL